MAEVVNAIRHTHPTTDSALREIESAVGNLRAEGEIPPVAVTLAAALGIAAGRCDIRWCEHNRSAGDAAPKVAGKRGV